MAQSEMNDRAILWDMDGVLMDTGDLHYLAWKKSLEEVNFNLTKEAFVSSFGKNNDSSVKLWLGEDVDPILAHQISERKEIIFRQILPGQVTLLPDVRDWLIRFQQWGMHQAVASSAPIENIDILVDIFELRPFFDALVSGEHLPGKPNPDVYLQAAKEVGVHPERCVVIEDSVHGVEGAKAARMTCIAVMTTSGTAVLANADLIVQDLTHLDETTVRALFS